MLIRYSSRTFFLGDTLRLIYKAVDRIGLLTGIINDQVLRLEVSVRNAFLVHVRQCVNNHRAVEEHVVWGQTCTGVATVANEKV